MAYTKVPTSLPDVVQCPKCKETGTAEWLYQSVEPWNTARVQVTAHMHCRACKKHWQHKYFAQVYVTVANEEFEKA